MSTNRSAFSLRAACAPAILASLLWLAPQAGAQVRYPRLALPGAIHGNGSPYLDSLGVIDPALIDAVSRYDLVALDASPITEYHPEVLAALRARNPDLQAIAYVLGEDIWEVNAADSLVHFPTRFNHLVRNLGGYLYDRNGGYYSPTRVNIARRDANGRYVVAEGLAHLFYDAVVSTGLWNGMFVDVYCDEITWSQAPSESIDIARAGYPSAAALDAGWRAGSDTLASRLRQLCGPDFILVGNCAMGSKYGWFNGWTRENFPYQGGGNWYTNMFNDPGGYFVDEARFRAPTHNQVFSTFQGTNPYDATNARKVRFGLASAALGSGFATFGPADRSAKVPPHDTWWYDEYAVDVATGRSVADRAHTGWLGAPLGPPAQMIWAGTNPDAVTNADFEADVTSGWTFGVLPPAAATLVQDAGTAAVGAASARISIDTPGAFSYTVNLTSVSRIAMIPGATYAVTFWAKASTPRTLSVATFYGQGISGVVGDVTLGTQWKQYQVILQPTTPGTAALEVMMGLQAGTVWLDDVHFQQGATSLWRRDFDNGIVLVNPSPFTLTAPLAGTWRRILGTVDTAVNDGATVTSATIGPSDALFLLTTTDDLVPPGAVRDAHVQP